MEALEGFVIGLYSAVFNAIVSLINRFVCQHAYCQKAHVLSLSLSQKLKKKSKREIIEVVNNIPVGI